MTVAAPTAPQLLDRTFAVLALFTEERATWSTTEVARACGLPTPTAHRILRSLRAHGFMEQDDDTKRFALGPAAISLGERARAGNAMRRQVAGPLARLAAETGGTAVLAEVAASRSEAVFLHRSSRGGGRLAHARPGVRVPLHAGATRKALLAFMPEREIARVLAARLPRMCRATITDPAVLHAHLEQVRGRGWAISREETEPNAWGIGVPICDRGEVIAAVGLAGGVSSLARRELASWLRRAHATADELADAVVRNRELRAPPGQHRVRCPV